MPYSTYILLVWMHPLLYDPNPRHTAYTPASQKFGGYHDHGMGRGRWGGPRTWNIKNDICCIHNIHVEIPYVYFYNYVYSMSILYIISSIVTLFWNRFSTAQDIENPQGCSRGTTHTQEASWGHRILWAAQPAWDKLLHQLVRFAPEVMKKYNTWMLAMMWIWLGDPKWFKPATCWPDFFVHTLKQPEHLWVDVGLTR